MKEYEYDNTGFVNFPNPYSRNIKQLQTGKTLIYLVAFDPVSKNLSKISLNSQGEFVGDDITPRAHIDTSTLSSFDVIEILKSQNSPDESKILEIPFVSCLLLGWSNFTWAINNDITPWICSFRELTEEGKKLYYSFKKLNYDKDIRILTFNKI
jgi:hypothetical protein